VNDLYFTVKNKKARKKKKIPASLYFCDKTYEKEQTIPIFAIKKP